MVGALSLVTGALWCIIAFGRSVKMPETETAPFGAFRNFCRKQTMKEISAEILSATAAEKSWAAVFSDLVKARLTTLVLLTTAVGFYIG